MSTRVEGYMLIKPDAVMYCDEVIRRANSQGLVCTGADTIRLSEDCVRNLYPERMNTDFEQTIIDYMTSGDCVVVRFSGENVVEKLKQIKGKTYQSGLRRDYADNFIHNSFHCPDDDDCCAEELNVLSKNDGRTSL